MLEFNDYLEGEAGWNDYVSSFIPSAVHPATTPGYTDMGNGMYALEFAETQAAFISFHIKHDILVGSKIYPHIHFSPTTNMAAGETIVWEVSGVHARGHHQGDVLSAPLTTLILTYTADGTELSGEHLVVEVSEAEAHVAPEVDALVLMRVTRGAGTYGAGVHGHTADLHYQIGRIATPQKSPDFYAPN